MKLGKSFCFIFLSVFFGLDGAQNTPFFEKITNEIFQLNYAQVICEPVRSKNQRLCIDCDNIVLAFEGFKVSYTLFQNGR